MTTNPHALTGAWILGAVDEAEQAEFEAHLDSCEDCRTEVRSLDQVLVRLALAESIAPPSAMKDEVRARIARTPQVPPAPSTGAAGGRATNQEPAAVRDRGTGAATVRRLDGRRLPRWTTLAAVAAALVVGVAGGTTVVNDRRHALQAEAVQATVMRIVSAPDAVSHDVALGASHVVLSAEMGAVAIMGQDVPMPDGDGMVYQVWMMRSDGTCEPGETFMPEHGDVTAVVKTDLGNVYELMVTEEPYGGSPAPTGTAVATLEL
ncbi:anti-sigma factor domain-containing protein [Actinotalea sp.]|uniref:anti-sigma factor n=1 Tax=Actinotalea sp. TaxID=1872145 RepID=UPI0035689BAB